MNRFLSISSFIVSITALLCVVFKVDVPISNDTFVGLGIAVIGVLATFMVAYQIFTSLDQNDRMRKVEKLLHDANSLQIKVSNELNNEQCIRRLQSAKDYKNSNALQSLHYALEALSFTFKTDDKYVETSLILEFIVEIEPSVVSQVEGDACCDIRNVESCLYYIDMYKRASFYKLTKNRVAFDSIYLKLDQLLKNSLCE